MTDRIYLVTDTDDSEQPQRNRLVRASTPAQARSHVARSRYSVGVADAESLIELTKLGVEVENAGEVIA